MVVQKLDMLEVRVEFDLIDRGRRLARLHDPIEVLGQVVADAYGLGQALGLHVLHSFPLLLVFLLAV